MTTLVLLGGCISETKERRHGDTILHNRMDSVTNGLLSNPGKSCNPAPAPACPPGVNFVPGPGWQYPQGGNPTKAGDTTSNSTATNTVNVYVDRNLMESHRTGHPPFRPPLGPPPHRKMGCSDDELAKKLQRLDDLIQAHEELFLKAQAMVAYWDRQIEKAQETGDPYYGFEDQKAKMAAAASAHKRGMEENKAEKAKYCSY